MDKMLVSVIVPVYNVEEYLEECLSSQERQSFSGFEVILVNDGSTDRSGMIAKRFAEKNEHFILIEQKNGGLSSARNTGLSAARGDYVYFLDSDDYLSDDALEILYSSAQENNLDVLKFSAFTFHDHESDFTWQREKGYRYSGEYPEVYEGPELLQRCIENNDIFPSCCLVFSRREKIEALGLRFCEGIVNEDNLFHYCLVSSSERVAVMNRPLYYRRFRRGSITSEPDRMNTIRSMCVSAEQAVSFIENRPQADCPADRWQIMFFVYTMLENWEKMPPAQQFSEEASEYFQRVRPFVNTYGAGGSRSLKLFYANRHVYKACKAVMKG